MLLADPPYGMGKEKDGVANDNLYGEKLDAFMMDCWRACRPALKDNASAYIWGNAEDLWRFWYRGGLEAGERLTMRNEIVWTKDSGQGMESESHRMYATASERALFFMLGEQGFNNNADNYWEGWDSVVDYLRQEKEKIGWDIATFKRLAGHSEKSGCHWFDRSQWSMPTRAVYDSWRNAAEGAAFKREHDDLKREHDDLKREHDDLKREFYATRAFFDNTHQSMTDVWHYARVTGNERHNHPTPKPVAMMARAVKSSCPPGGTVLDPFAGTCPTAIACIRTGRRFIGIECDPTHYASAVQRITNELAQGELFHDQRPT
ncbi:MAG: site-specific DNA-methyltransferase [Planctomycetota bacterium]|nr:site-specific DNA-methyltransferase [Planctomycetota bacterium]